MFQYTSSLVAVVILTITAIGCQSEPIPEVAQPAVSTAGTEAKVLALLAVNTDGTVGITDEAKAAELIGNAWQAARAELTTLNQRIKSGETKGFRSAADLARYTHRQPSYQPKLDETGEANFTPAFSDPNNPQCTMKCMEPGNCCCSSFWFLCWGYCTCKP